MNEEIKRIRMEMIDLLPIADSSKEVLKKQILEAYDEGFNDGLDKAKDIYHEAFK